MKNIKLILFLLVIGSPIIAQDNYHTLTEQMIVDSYGLQNGEWMLFDNELENLSIDYFYGPVDLIQLTSTTENFSQITNILNETEGGYFYSSGWGIPTQEAIQENDICLLIVNLRKTNNVNDLGKVTLGIQADDTSIIEESITIQLEEEWNQYLIPFQASRNYLPGELLIALGLAWEVQEIEVAGINILNFSNNYSLDDLPFEINSERYQGYEADAPWRDQAATRIEINRKADLDILVTSNSGNPITGASVAIRMLQHEFKWGTEIQVSRFAGNNLQEAEYENKLLDIDGAGHRLDWVVPGAAFKWPGIEEGWIAPFTENVNAMNWLKDNGFKTRFHTLVWPGWINSPFDIEANANDPQYIIDRTNDWLDFILTHPDLQNVFDEYDVLNETTTNRDYEMTFAGFGPYVTGREYYIEVMNQFSNLVPDKPAVIVDYVTISSQQNKGIQYDFLQNTIQEILDGGADLQGIGFQAHIGHFPTSIYEVEAILTDFASKYDVPLKITEYDFDDQRMDPNIAANYLDDFLTMIFSIPEVDMFMFWGIWDGAHWQGNGNLFREDWTAKPAAAVTFNKLFNEWWTEENGETNSNGLASFRGFKGTYEVVIQYQGESLVDTISLSDDLQLSFNIDQATATNEVPVSFEITTYPNPALNSVFIESKINISDVELYDLNGKLQLSKSNVNRKVTQLFVNDMPSGMYFLKLYSNGKITEKRIEIINQ